MLRQRNVTRGDQDPRTPSKPENGVGDGKRASPGLRGSSILLLGIARLASALVNLIHDCDEVYNYWEPLHHLLYGWGYQTWEYSAEFALRSYWYLDLHYAWLKPWTALLGRGRGERGPSAGAGHALQ